MVGTILRALALFSFGLVAVTPLASAQDTVRLRGTVERIDGPIFVVKTRDGSEVKLTVTDNPLWVVIVPGKMSDIKPGMFVGSAGMMQEDGTQKAIEVHIFPESMRGTGEGHYDWDLLPKSKMTNGNVEQSVTGVDGPVLSVKYKDGEKKLVVTPHQDLCERREEASRWHPADAAYHVRQEWRGTGVLIPQGAALRLDLDVCGSADIAPANDVGGQDTAKFIA
jgi:hypothetical protein